MPPFEDVRRARGVAVFAFVAAIAAIAVGGVAVIAALPELAAEARQREVPGALALTGDVVRIAIILGVVILWLGGLRARDVGLVWDRLPPALVFTLLLWGSAQAIGLLSDWIDDGVIAPHQDWDERGVPTVLGRLLTQMLSVALIEEAAYRGFLMPQVYLWLGAVSPPLRLGLAVGLSQALFAAIHGPFLLFIGVPRSELPIFLAIVLLAGIFFCWIYLRTNNLFLAVGTHGLMTAPTLMFASVIGGPIIVAVCALVLTLWWTRPGGHRSGHQGYTSRDYETRESASGSSPDPQA